MFTSIAGRAVVVTGGTRGIGKGIASVFARNGAKVLITGRDSDTARAAAEELHAQAAAAGRPARSRSCWPTWPAGRTAAGWPRSPRSGWAASTCSAPTPGSSPTPASRT